MQLIDLYESIGELIDRGGGYIEIDDSISNQIFNKNKGIMSPYQLSVRIFKNNTFVCYSEYVAPSKDGKEYIGIHGFKTREEAIEKSLRIIENLKANTVTVVLNDKSTESLMIEYLLDSFLYKLSTINCLGENSIEPRVRMNLSILDDKYSEIHLGRYDI